MIYLELFLSFLKIGAVSFGGGYAMISLIREVVVESGWLSEAQFLDFVAVAESTPGPIAVNIATFVGSSQGGWLGALVGTLGVALPSFVIILIIAALVKNLMKYNGVKAFVEGIRPCIVALIIGTAITMGFNLFINITESGVDFQFANIAIISVIVVIDMLYSYVSKKKMSPIIMIIISAALGIVIF